MNLAVWGVALFALWLYIESPLAERRDLAFAWRKYTAYLSRFFENPVLDFPLLIRYVAQNYALTLLLIAIDAAVGMAALWVIVRRPRRVLPPALRAAAALAFGAGIATLAMFVLGRLHLLKADMLIGVTILSALAAAFILRKRLARRWATSFLHLPNRRTFLKPGAVILIAAMLPVVVIYVFDSMTPPMSFDVTMYHMAAAKMYKQSQSLGYYDNLRMNAQPQLSELLYLRHWMLLGDDALVKLVNLEFLLILGFLLLYFVRSLQAKSLWKMGVLYVAAIPLFWPTAKSAKVELSLAAFVGVAVGLAIHHLRKSHPSFPILVGLACGFAISCKTLGLMFMTALMAGLIAAALAIRMRPKHLARLLVSVGLVALLVASPWFLRAWHHTGAPLYPFLISAKAKAEHNAFSVNTVYKADLTPAGILQALANVMLMQTDKFLHPFGFGPAVILVVILGFPAALRLWRIKRENRAVLLCLVVTLLAYAVLWAATAPVQRYLMPTVPILAFLYLFVLKLLPPKKLARLPLAALCILVCFHASILVSPTATYGPPPATYTQKDLFLARALPYYLATRALNSVLMPEDRVYLLYSEQTPFYIDALSYGGWFGKYDYSWATRGVETAEQLIARLRDNGFDYLFVNRRRVETHLGDEFKGTGLAARDIPIPCTREIYDGLRYAAVKLGPCNPNP